MNILKFERTTFVLVAFFSLAGCSAPSTSKDTPPAVTSQTDKTTPDTSKTPDTNKTTDKSVSTKPKDSGSSGTSAGTTAAQQAAEAAQRAAEAALPPTVNGEIAVPKLKISPAQALSATGITVAVSTDQERAPIYYTMDGSDPSVKNGRIYKGPIKIESSTVLRVSSAFPKGNAGTASGAFTIGEVIVAPGGTGEGRWDAPLGSVASGIEKALAIGLKAVHIESGTFHESIILEKEISLSGGWNKEGKQDKQVTLIQSDLDGNSSQNNPLAAIKVQGKGGSLSLDNIDLRGGDSWFGAALAVLSGGNAVVRNSRLTGGSGTYSYGIRAVGAAKVQVEDSSLSGGDGGSTFGFSSDSSGFQIVRSTLNGGTGNAVSYAFSITGSKGAMASTTLYGGGANSSYGAALYSSQGVTLTNCTILGGKGSSAWGIFVAESNPEVVNCIIGSEGKSKSFGIYENYGNSSPKKVEACAFFGSASGFYFDNDLKKALKTLNSAGAFTDAGGKVIAQQSKNVTVEPVLGPAPEFAVLAASPPEIHQGGSVVTGDAAKDRNGRDRGASWSIGADQLN